MTNVFAAVPANPWGIKIPAAAYGAQQLPIPQPATVGEVKTPAYRDKLKAAAEAQIKANAEAHAARRTQDEARPYRQTEPRSQGVTPTGAAEISGPAPRATVPVSSAAQNHPQGQGKSQHETDHDRGAAAARALLSGEAMASPFEATTAPRPAASSTADEHRARGEAAVIELIGTPEEQRANRAAQGTGLAAGGSDAAAGAAEARRLLGKE